MSELLKDDFLEEEEQLTFVVDDDQKAEWCMEKIREAEAEKERWKTFYADRLDKICKAEDAKIERMKFFLEQYFRTVPHKQTKTQESYALPSGKLTVKQKGPQYDVDDSVLVPWLKENGYDEYVKTKETANWAELKKIVEVCDYEHDGVEEKAVGIFQGDNGFIVPGVSVTFRDPEFQVEVK